MTHLCLARLAYRDVNTITIGEGRHIATVMKLCPNKAEKGSKLCKRCSERPKDGKAQSIALHGDLTEEPPSYSHVFGGKWFWTHLVVDPPSYWLELAEAAQIEGEKRCIQAGVKPWRLEDYKDEMPPPKKKSTVVPVDPKIQKLPFKPIPQFFQETAEEPKMLPTDTQKIWKEDGKWVCATGFLFEVREDGGIGKFVGKR